MTDKHVFLSESWFAAAEALLDGEEFVVPEGTAMVMNLVVDETPFSEDVTFFIGALDGRTQWGHGHHDAADLVVATDYVTAKEIFISGDPMTGMSAFFAGKVRLQGDLTKLAEAAASAGGPGAVLGFASPELTERIQAITE